jgi:hypothetical protein
MELYFIIASVVTMKGKVLGIASGFARESPSTHCGTPLFQVHSNAGQNSLRKNKIFEPWWRHSLPQLQRIDARFSQFFAPF